MARMAPGGMLLCQQVAGLDGNKRKIFILREPLSYCAHRRGNKAILVDLPFLPLMLVPFVSPGEYLEVVKKRFRKCDSAKRHVLRN